MSIEHFHAGSFSVTEEEKEKMNPEELAELEEKIKMANKRAVLDASEKAIADLEKAIAKDLEEE